MEPWDNVHWLPLCLTNVSLHSCLQLSDNKKNLPKNCVTWTSFTDLNHRPVSLSFLDSFDFLCSTGENQMNTKRWLFTDQCSFCTLRWLFESLLVFSVCISVCFVGIFSSCPFPLVSLTFCIFGPDRPRVTAECRRGQRKSTMWTLTSSSEVSMFLYMPVDFTLIISVRLSCLSGTYTDAGRPVWGVSPGQAWASPSDRK